MTTVHYRPTRAIIDLQAIQSNIRGLKKCLHEQTEIIAVVKANAYGHGDVEVALAAIQAGASVLAVATPEEAIHLRESGIRTDLLILGASPISFAKIAADHNIILTVFSKEWLEEVEQVADTFKSPLKIHMKLDTGMGRIGVRAGQESNELLQVIGRIKAIQLDGVYTHFATADEESIDFLEEQARQFKAFIQGLSEKPRLIHAANSATALMHKELQFDAVRFGISMYGVAPSLFVENHLPFELKPALSLQSELIQVKLVEKGTSIGYGRTYTAKTQEWIGTIPIGYADGLQRGLSGQEVIVGGQRVPIVGRVCMDQCMIRLPEEYSVGEKVVLIGKQLAEQIKIEEWANRLHTIPYEIMVLLTNRIPRVYV